MNTDPGERSVSVIVPVYNREELLPNCLASLVAQDYPRLEIIVIDDGSTDRTAEVARRYPVKVISLDENQGAAIARNEGANAATGDYLAFTDSDCVAPPDWVSKMVAVLEENPGFVGVNGTYDGDLSDTFVSDFAFRLNRFKEQKSPAAIDTCNTSTFMCERQALLDAGGFPRFFDKKGREIRGREDAALALRITTTSGRKILMAPGVVVSQYFRPSWHGFLKQQATFSYCFGVHGVSVEEEWFADASSFDRRGTMLQLLGLGVALSSAPLALVLPPAALATTAGLLGFLLPQKEFLREYPGLSAKVKAVGGLTATSLTWGAAGLSGVLAGLAMNRK